MSDCRRCATCHWWQRMGARLSTATRDPAAAHDHGTCQVRAPVVAPGEYFPVSLFPVTQEDRFCGDWRVRGDGGDPDDGERIIAFPLSRPANKVAA